MQRFTWVPPEQGYKVVSVIERSLEQAKAKVAFHVRERIRVWDIVACEYYGMNETNDFPFDKHMLAVTPIDDIYEHTRS